MASGAESKGLVLVTGATGYIAGHLVRRLLADGWRVRGTCRDKSSQRADVLRALDGAAERLELVEADSLVEGSYKGAVAGVTHVFHTASPFRFDADKPEDLLEPAVRGTVQVLEAAADEPSVERVVVTSSFAAILNAPTNPGHKRPYTEENWNLESVEGSDDRILWYRVSKANAERAAWSFMADRKPKFTLCTVNPPLVIGSFLPGYKTANQSASVVLGLMDGSKATVGRQSDTLVDVIEVVEAHVQAAFRPDAAGRYAVSGGSTSWGEVCDILRRLYPARAAAGKIPTEAPAAPDAAPLTIMRICTDKADKDLGLAAIRPSIESSIKSQADSLIASGLLEPIGDEEAKLVA